MSVRRRGRRDRLVAIATACALAAFALGACGVPTDSSPRSISNDDLPEALRTNATTTTLPPGTQRDIVAVYWIHGNDLVRSNEPVKAPVTLDSTLEVLQRGPTDAETRAGDRSALSGTELIRRATASGPNAVIDLDPSFGDTPQDDQILALGQLVLTATEQPDISSVSFTVDGAATQVPRADGTLTTSPLRAADYRSLVAPR